MDLPVINYAALPTPEYIPTGLNAFLPALSQGIQGGLNMQQSRQAIQQQKLANALAQLNLQNAPAMNQADLAYKQAQTQNLPLQALGSYYGGLGKYNYSNWTSSPQAQLLRTINNPMFQAQVANNPAMAAQTGKAFSNITQGAGGMPSPSMNGQQLPLNPAQIASLQQALGVNPQDINAIQQTAGSSALKKTNTSQQLNQQLFANTVDAIFKQTDPMINDVAQYSGLMGKTGKFIDSIESALGKSSPQYSNYLKFSRVDMPALANDLRRQLGGQATDQETKLMSSLANPDHWDSNPKQALAEYQQLKSLLQQHVNPVLGSAPYQNQQNLQSNSSSSQGADEDDPLGIMQ